MKTTLKTILVSAAALMATATPAFADKATEAYVMKNANMALQSLNNPSLTADERRVEFNKLMDEFTDLDLIAMRVLDHYYRSFSDKEKADFTAAFREFALANYESELDKYRGSQVTVTGSTDEPANKFTKVDSTIESTIALPGRNLPVRWRVVEFQPDSKYAEVFGAGYKLTDVALELNGNIVWLGQRQKEQFLAILDRNNGSAAALIARVKELTQELKAEAGQSASISAATPTNG